MSLAIDRRREGAISATKRITSGNMGAIRDGAFSVRSAADWLGRQDSNLGSRDQNPLPYRLATPQSPEMRGRLGEKNPEAARRTYSAPFPMRASRHGQPNGGCSNMDTLAVSVRIA
jgi:hypothetical protein